MTPVFLDTSYLLAAVSKRDAFHAKAMSLRDRVGKGWITTDFVVIEFLDALAGEQTRRLAALVVSSLRADAAGRVLLAGAELVDAGFALYRQRADKSWGLTDCISFAVMQRERLQEAASADRHFEQAGFRALML